MREDTAPAGNANLIVVIRDAIAEAGGAITFARFMELALTHPAHGYYASGRGAPGRAGADFLTAPETSPFFGRCLAVQVAECWHRLGEPADFHIWEPGAGAGTLAVTLLDALAAIDPAAHAATTYWLDDLSPATEAPRPLTARGRPPHGFIGVVLTNEFVDALPVHRVRWRSDNTLEEEYVIWDADADAFASRWSAPSTDALEGEWAIPIEDGEIGEISLAAIDWLRAVTAQLGRGYVITIDYGDEIGNLYLPGRFPHGSLMCYSQHTTNRQPLRRVGEQDMTAHVDFTALKRAGMAAGLMPLGLTTQAAFLASLGLGEMLYNATQAATDPFVYIAERDAVIRLIEPSAMGRNRVLLQAKSVPPLPPLRGLSEPPIW